MADEAAPVPMQVRYSATPETVRVVLDLPKAVTYTDQSTPKQVQVALPLPLAKALEPVTIDDPLVTLATVTPDAEGNAVLRITLAKARRVRICTLEAAEDKPFRLVVDVLKRYTKEERRALSPAVSYIHLERQTDDGYLAAHFVTVDTSKPGVHFSAVPAQGCRERASEMVARTGAVCGVNGGYFLGNIFAHPVGLLKAEDKILSMPLWERTAAAFPTTGVPTILNPRGTWRFTLPDGTTREFPDSLDATAQTPAPVSVIVNGYTFAQAPGNANGLTLLLYDGHVLGRAHTAFPLAPGEYALQLTRDDAQTLGAQLLDETAITLEPVITPDLAGFPSAVGAGPRLLRDGQIALTGEKERFQPDILLGRNARTALGLTADKCVILAAIEAPGPYGGGATLAELAQLLKDRGATDAMNFDGGGSTQLAIGPTTVTVPPGTWVRPVASGVLVFDGGAK